MKKVTFITTNEGKWNISRRVLSEYKIELLRENLETPEIQSFDAKDVAIYSAEFAAEKLQRPVIKTDVGYYINSLNGFPGPFIKYINNWLSSDDILTMLKDKIDRTVLIKEYLAFSEPGRKTLVFVAKDMGKIAQKAEGQGSAIDKILIRERQNQVQALYSASEMLDYWSKNLDHFRDFGEYIKKGHQ